MTTSEAPYRRPTYGNFRAPTSPGIYGLGSIGTGILLAGGIATVLTMKIVGLLAALVPAVVVALVLLLLLRKNRHGKNGLQRVGVRVGWWVTRARGAHLYRSGMLGALPCGSHQLPGLAAGSELTEWRDSWDRPFALLAYPSTGDYAVAFTSEPDGASLVDPDQVDAWVATWGGYLAMLGDEPGLVGAQVVIETAPDPGVRLRREVEDHLDPDAPDLSRKVLTEIMNDYPVGSASLRAWVVLTFSAWLREDSKRRSTEEVARDLAIRLPGLREELLATGAGAARSVTADDWCEELLVAYDPAAADRLAAARAAGEPVTLFWDQVGPVAAQAQWDRYRHDGAVSMSWEMSHPPRGEVFSSVLEHLLDAHPDVPRKRVSLLYRPLDSASSAVIVDRDKRAAETVVREAGKRATARHLDARDAARQAAKEEARGAGLVNTGMVVTATAADDKRMVVAEGAVDHLAATARVTLRRVFGGQDSAFAFSLPLGLVPSRHVSVPSEIRERL